MYFPKVIKYSHVEEFYGIQDIDSFISIVKENLRKHNFCKLQLQPGDKTNYNIVIFAENYDILGVIFREQLVYFHKTSWDIYPIEHQIDHHSYMLIQDLISRLFDKENRYFDWDKSKPIQQKEKMNN